MESVEERAGDQILWPHERSRPDEVASADAREGEANNVRREYSEEIEANSFWDPVELVERSSEVECIRWRNGDIRHNDNDCVFFDVEWTWIHAELAGKEQNSLRPPWRVEDARWEYVRKELAHRVRDDLDCDRSDERRRVAHTEEEVDPAS